MLALFFGFLNVEYFRSERHLVKLVQAFALDGDGGIHKLDGYQVGTIERPRPRHTPRLAMLRNSHYEVDALRQPCAPVTSEASEIIDSIILNTAIAFRAVSQFVYRARSL